MEFRDLKKQYQQLKPQMDAAIQQVLHDANFISGKQVAQLEEKLAEYVGVKHCITCGNGTDALSLVMMAWDIKEGDMATFSPTRRLVRLDLPTLGRPMTATKTEEVS